MTKRKLKLVGSLVNRLAETADPKVTPVVGMGATELQYTDRDAYTIVEILSEKRILVQEDKAIRKDNNGMSEMQVWEFEPNPNAKRTIVSLCKDGRWHKGTNQKGNIFTLGERDKYHDYSF